MGTTYDTPFSLRILFLQCTHLQTLHTASPWCLRTQTSDPDTTTANCKYPIISHLNTYPPHSHFHRYSYMYSPLGSKHLSTPLHIPIACTRTTLHTWQAPHSDRTASPSQTQFKSPAAPFYCQPLLHTKPSISTAHQAEDTWSKWTILTSQPWNHCSPFHKLYYHIHPIYLSLDIPTLDIYKLHMPVHHAYVHTILYVL
jgi:hypothetical protein